MELALQGMLKGRPHRWIVSEISGELAGRPMSDAAWVVNEAARLAARAKKDMIGDEELSEALDRLGRTNH